MADSLLAVTSSDVGGRVRPPPLSELPRLVQLVRGSPQSPAILVSPPRSFTPVPACVANGDVFAPSAFELLPPPARRNSRQLVASARSLSANDLSASCAALEPRREVGTSLDAERLEATLLGREMEQSFRASGRRIMAQGVTTIASVRGGSLVRSTFSAEAASRKLSVPDPPPASAVPLARPASCHQLSTILAGSAKVVAGMRRAGGGFFPSTLHGFMSKDEHVPLLPLSLGSFTAAACDCTLSLSSSLS
ncbi:hypothetical protein HPB52_001348 [Rhipicephalus sanguineus]|uniref:Uncharacterized protein n=1 Tax=Rhipicephalus sanguineus TaxID=34632 RepID=A0A9D4QBH8_RHISA|nr:hypothetical protein HPB52_001348 [Rhipicephalus sanguineus]